ncbi:hypothetical protein [Bernardetia sp.]|uniref:hypothetical protein n=1 Tax=Bernardetia sp. TaxID=1937974 RepID=UPI0025BEEE19|nr:hypothetical protein [Bernardetia sp.]
MKNLSIEEILETVFTTENPETGSQPPEQIGWVIFENETVCLIGKSAGLSENPSAEEMADFAKKELLELGVPMVGSPSADFNVSRVPWFKEQFVYMITYDSNFIFNVLTYEEETSDISVGMEGRSVRGLDAETPKIKLVRDHEKNTFTTIEG